jgi:hypothetical protein
MRPFAPRLAYGPTGAIVDLDEQEADAERERIEAENREAKRKVRDAEQREQAAVFSEWQEAKRQQMIRETPEGMPIP